MKQLIAILVGIFVFFQMGCRHNPSRPIGVDAIALESDNLFQELVAVRRDIHAHPELAGTETRTATTVANHLRDMGLEVRMGDDEDHHVIGILRGGHPGKTIAWRAELDALPGEFADPENFKSKTRGVHHACGHDVHIAIALGIAKILAKHRASLHGTAIFIFQPEEETFKGAKALIDLGVLSSFDVDEIYGVHVTAFPVGQIVVKDGEVFAHQRRVSIKLQGELSTEDVAQLSRRLHGALSRARLGAKPWDLQNIIDPGIGLTASDTAFQNYLILNENFDVHSKRGETFLENDLYETKASNLDKIIPRIKQAIDESDYKNKLISVSFTQANPTVVNHEKLTHEAMHALQSAFGEEAIRPAFGQVPFFNDDFAYYQETVPGVYFFLGGSNAKKGIVAMNHAPNFQVDEESIRIGVKRFSTLLIARLDALTKVKPKSDETDVAD